MGAEEHIQEAERFATSAEEQPDRWGRSVDLQAAQVHATVAQTLKAAELLPLMTRLAEWIAPEEPDPVTILGQFRVGAVEDEDAAPRLVISCMRCGDEETISDEAGGCGLGDLTRWAFGHKCAPGGRPVS